MDDRKLADRIVALGIARKWKEGITPGGYKIEGRSGAFWLDPHTFVRNWRVAGALMERMVAGELLIWRQAYDDDSPVWIVETHLTNADGRDESLPRAINEACVEALNGSA